MIGNLFSAISTMRVLFVCLSIGLALSSPAKKPVDLSEFGEPLEAVHGVGPVIIGKTPVLGGDDHDLYAADFAEFEKQFGKEYATVEERNYRYELFKGNMAKAKIYQETDAGTAKYGATQFADMSEDEFSKYVMPSHYFAQGHDLPYAEIPDVSDIPDSVDWRKKGAVTEVKNQGQCGSCWAFSTTGNIEGQWFLKKGQLVSLSEQELVSCDKVDDGCEGGLPSQAYKQIIDKLGGGLETEKAYPYDGVDEKCKLSSQNAVYINSSVAISKDEGEMAAWLAKNGPISIGINANMMQLYMGGIAHPWSIFCSPTNLDHGVLIVGYGTESGKPFWIIKNSWGPSWGEQGYYRIYRGAGCCGLNQMCTSAVVN